METSVLSWYQVPAEMRELYILTGYRPPCTGFIQGIRSAFCLHNETLNVWTHMLPLLYFMYFVVVDDELLNSLANLDSNQRYPLYGYLLGLCILFATSSFAHLMNCAWSRCGRNVCFVLDYAAITVFGVASAIVYQYLVRPVDGSSAIRFLGMTTASAVVAMWVCCWSRLTAHPMSHVIRTAAFALPFIFGSQPAVYRYLSTYIPVEANNATSNGTNINEHMTPAEPDLLYQERYPRHFALLVGGATIKALKVPERWRPGVFDIVGHSHQLFHVFIFLGIREQFWLLLDDILHVTSQKRLSTVLPESTPAVVTFALLTLLILANVVIICWFAQSLSGQVHITAQENLWFQQLQQQQKEASNIPNTMNYDFQATTMNSKPFGTSQSNDTAEKKYHRD